MPSLMTIWLKYVREYRVHLPGLRDVFASGESLTPGLVQEFYRCFPDARLHNLYGPAECTIDVTYYDCRKGDLSIPIGRPVSGTKIRILNALGQCQPPGIEGELSVTGVLVGEGYLGLSSDKFRRDENGEKVYDTGDRAVLGFDGQIYYLGRNDSQHKINGMRVDLAQIESVMNEYPGVLCTAVLYTQKQIIGFYMAEHELAGLSPYLKRALPYYCIPQRLVFCRNIPLNSNGKTDRNYLEGLLTAPQVAAPESREEKVIYELVKEKLGKDVSVEENLFLAGVDSLMVMDLVIELEKKGFGYTPEDLYENLTIRKLAAEGAKGYQWLVKKGQRVLVLAFPYAAGNAEDYKSLAARLGRRGVDFCVARAADRVPEITHYDSVILLGYCTGCAEAMLAAERFSDGGRKPDGMVLCAAVPLSRRMAEKGSPWADMGDDQIGRILDYLHGTAMDWNRENLNRFRKDTDRFFRYFARNHEKISADAVISLLNHRAEDERRRN